MDELQKLLAALTLIHSEMTTLSGKKAAETDADKAKTIQGAYDLKAEEFVEIKGQVDALKAQLENAKFLEETKALVTPDDKGKALNPDGQPGDKGKVGTEQDPVKDEHNKRQMFVQYCKHGSKALKENELNAMVPNDSRVKNAVGDSLDGLAVTLPASMYAELTGLPMDERGKVMLSTDATGGVTDSGGQELVPPDFRPTLLRAPVAIPLIYNQCRVVRSATGGIEYPMLEYGTGGGPFGGVAFTWKATEGADKAETEPTFRNFEIATAELSGWTELSLTMLSRSAIALEGELTALFRDAARYEFSKKIIDGTGTNQPEGILVGAGTTLIVRQSTNAIDWADITNCEYGVSMGFRTGGRFLASDVAEGYLKQSVDTENRPLFTPNTAGGIRVNMAGYSYSTHEYLTALGSKGDLIFGNFMNYMFAIEENIAIARSDHAEFKKGRVVFRMIAFVGGKMIFPQAFTILDV